MSTKKTEVLTSSEINSLKDEKRSAEQTLKELESYGSGTQADAIDKAKLSREVSHFDKLINVHSGTKISGAAKDKMAKRAKELAGTIKEGMPTYEEMNNLGKNPGAPLKNLNWERRNAKSINEYKQIMRRIEPGSSSVENLRR